MAPCTAMPWFWRTSSLRSLSCACAPDEPAGQRDLDRARPRVEHLVGRVLERQELEELQRVLVHLHDDPRRPAPMVITDGSRGARQRPDLGARAAALGHRERRGAEAHARASRSPPRSRSSAPVGRSVKRADAGGVALAAAHVDLVAACRPCRARIGVVRRSARPFSSSSWTSSVPVGSDGVGHAPCPAVAPERERRWSSPPAAARPPAPAPRRAAAARLGPSPAISIVRTPPWAAS